METAKSWLSVPPKPFFSDGGLQLKDVGEIFFATVCDWKDTDVETKLATSS
jgi:hypothetical protein